MTEHIDNSRKIMAWPMYSGMVAGVAFTILLLNGYLPPAFQVLYVIGLVATAVFGIALGYYKIRKMSAPKFIEAAFTFSSLWVIGSGLSAKFLK